MTTTTAPKARRGFAAMSPETLRQIARKGGAAVPPHLRSFSKDNNLATEAGRIGGRNSCGGGRKPSAAE